MYWQGKTDTLLSFLRCCEQLASQRWGLKAQGDEQPSAHQHTRRVTQPFCRLMNPKIKGKKVVSKSTTSKNTQSKTFLCSTKDFFFFFFFFFFSASMASTSGTNEVHHDRRPFHNLCFSSLLLDLNYARHKLCEQWSSLILANFIVPRLECCQCHISLPHERFKLLCK